MTSKQLRVRFWWALLLATIVALCLGCPSPTEPRDCLPTDTLDLHDTNHQVVGSFMIGICS